MFDLKIKNAKIIDGCGNASFSGEIGVTDNTIIERGKKIGQAKHIFNAKGLTLCPGIIDVQTNYCSPITWDNALCSLFRSGTTTAIIGNCILGAMIPKNRKRKKNLSKLTKLERIHYNFPKDDIKSEFNNCTEYFKFLKKIKPFINICSVISHSDLRFWVMGKDATKRKANNKEISNMEKILRDAMQNGIIGFASSNFDEHNRFSGIPFPSKVVSKEELKRLVKAMSKYARGVFMTTNSNNLTINDIIDIIGNTKRPTVVSTLFHNLSKNDRARKTLDEIYLARKKGFEIWGSVYYKSGKIEFSMNEFYMFTGISTWNEFKKKNSSEEKFFSIEEAVQSLTSKQADIWRIPKRGRLVPGHYADMILIDESKIEYAGLMKRKSLFYEPLRSVPISNGIHAMWINGKQLNLDLQTGSHGEVIRSFLT